MNEPPETPLAARLSAMMQARAWSQAELARQAGVRPDIIRTIFSRATTPSAGNANRIAAALGVSTTWLVDGRGPGDRPVGMADDAAPFAFDSDDLASAAVSSVLALMKSRHRGLEAWTVMTDEWAGEGLARGDTAFVRVDRPAAPGELAVCQIYDADGEAVTRIRRVIDLGGAIVLADPTLSSATADDGEHGRALAPIVGLFRLQA